MKHLSALLLAIVVLNCICAPVRASALARLCGTGEPRISDCLDISVIAIPKDMPKTYNLSHSLYGRNVKVNASADIPAEIAERERAYSWSWMRWLLQRPYFPERIEDSISLVRGINGKDDAACVAYTVPVKVLYGQGPLAHLDEEDCLIQLIDSRDLSLLIRQKWIQGRSMEAIIQGYMPYMVCPTVAIRVTEDHMVDASRSYGKVQIEYLGLPASDSVRFEWYRQGDAVLFISEKMHDPYESKTPLDPTTFIGGIPYSDPRPYLRFEKSNRVELSSEYWEKRRPEWKSRLPKADPHEVKGKALPANK